MDEQLNISFDALETWLESKGGGNASDFRGSGMVSRGCPISMFAAEKLGYDNPSTGLHSIQETYYSSEDTSKYRVLPRWTSRFIAGVDRWRLAKSDGEEVSARVALEILRNVKNDDKAYSGY